ncbi:MAG: potassium transporter Kup [Caldilineaceae bacterium]
MHSPISSASDPTNGAGPHGRTPNDPRGKALFLLALGALGVVYGDIGTSPLYAFRESFHEEYGLAVTAQNVLGILSLIFWSLIIVITLKYLLFVMRADNRGEGGILALTALVAPQNGVRRFSRRWLLILLGLFGTALLYGDGMITPAISVLSAVEGLEVATPLFTPYVIPITIVILVALFLFQSSGTEKVGQVFGPLTLIWFVVLALLGIRWIVQRPDVLVAVNPLLGLEFFGRNGFKGFAVLGSVFLVVTGGEALYADMGHFGKSPIRLAWLSLVLPCLVLNYFGQGALLLDQPEAVVNPFYRMAPAWALYPVVLIATSATVIASQALITGAFSLAMQSVQLGYLPRLEIRHTSHTQFGQIYIPTVNWILMIACVALVLAFRRSSNLAAAYGVAVTTTMVVTTILLFVVQTERWKWPVGVALALSGFFLVIDLAFWGANLLKIPAGGWFPLVVGAFVFTLMTTWKRGRQILAERLRAGAVPFRDFTEQIDAEDVARVPGTAVFMYSDPAMTPPALLRNLRHNRVLHELVILLSVRTLEQPFVPRGERVSVNRLGTGFSQVVLSYGFMETPNIQRDLAVVHQHGLDLDLDKITYFLGRERLYATSRPGMAIWRERLFSLMSRNSRSATDFFGLPADRVVELGTQVEL